TATATSIAESTATPAAEETRAQVTTAELQVVATNGALSNGNGHAVNGSGTGAAKPITLNLGGQKVAFAAQADAPSCAECGSIMVRNGSGYQCPNLRGTSGPS